MSKKKGPMSYKEIGGTAFVASMFVGMGAGFFTGNFLPGMFIGMGIGFAFQAIINLKARDEMRERKMHNDHDEEL